MTSAASARASLLDRGVVGGKVRRAIACLVMLPGVLGTCVAPPASGAGLAASDEAFLETLSERTFRWFWETTPASNGLTPDRSPGGPFASIAAVGFALTAYPVGVERGYITRAQAVGRVLATLRFFRDARQGIEPEGMTGYRGFSYHFLHPDNGTRFRSVELSTIDTALLMCGVLFCQSYFDGAAAGEAEIRELADLLYRRVEWDWALERPPLISMGWHPDSGFIRADYKGYNEAMFLYLLALGSPTFPVSKASWDAYTSTYLWGDFFGYEHVNFSPLFGHQYAHVWIDFRGIRDGYMREKGIDYFENSRRATYSQRAYAIANPGGWRDYGANLWGLTACDGPAGIQRDYGGQPRRFHTYMARGASLEHVQDDGTIAPTAAGGSIPFAPEITIPALEAMRDRYGDALFTKYGFLDAFNPTFTFEDVKLTHGSLVPGKGWVADNYLGIDQGPILLMAENHRTGFVWKVMRRNPHIVRGLKRAGFTGGWLDSVTIPAVTEPPRRDRAALLAADKGGEARLRDERGRDSGIPEGPNARNGSRPH